MTKAYLIHVNDESKSGLKDVKDWKEIDPLLECDTFDVTRVKLEDRFFSIYCDDEGLLKEPEDIRWGAVQIVYQGNVIAYQPMLAGNLLVYSAELDDEGYELDLTDEEIEIIERHIIQIPDEKGPHDTLAVN